MIDVHHTRDELANLQSTVFLLIAPRWLRNICIFEEVQKKEEEEDSVTTDEPNKRSGIVAIVDKKLKRVGDDHDELDHLQTSQILLPPEVLVVLRAHGGDHVVKIHHNVDEGVHQAEERAVPA